LLFFIFAANKFILYIKTNSLFVGERALVIGGGGSLGNAWLIGVIAGLFDSGLDVTQTDLVIGTSAGSTTAAQVTSTTPPPELFASILSEVHQPRTASIGDNREGDSNRDAPNHMAMTNEIIAGSKDIVDMRRKMGVWALERNETAHISSQQWRAMVAARLPGMQWPQQQLFITAIDAHSGEPVIFNRDSGVDLVDAVAASCAGGFAFQIGEKYYIDGGYRSNADNADLAAGYRRVLVLPPFGGRSRTPVDWGTHLATQVDELRANDSVVETIFPDSDALAVFGDNMMDVSRRPLAARTGYNQGKIICSKLTEFWN